MDQTSLPNVCKCLYSINPSSWRQMEMVDYYTFQIIPPPPPPTRKDQSSNPTLMVPAIAGMPGRL